MENKIDKVLVKVKKLLNLSESPNCEEAENALLLAQKLMVKYNIKEEELKNIKEEQKLDIKEEKLFKEYGKHRLWKYDLAFIIAKNFNCGLVKNSIKYRGNIPRVVGQDENIKIVKQLYFYAEEIIKREALVYARTKHRENNISKAKLKKSFIEGFIEGLDDKLKKQYNSFQEKGLILNIEEDLEKYMKKEMNVRKTIETSPRKDCSESAILAGYNRGLEASLHFELDKNVDIS